MKTIEEKISWAKTQQDNAKRLREAFEKQIEETKANLKVAMDADAMDTQYEGGDMDDGRKKRGGQGGKSKPPKQKGRNSPFP
jgi:formylmethanofuran dehydrogenase subunit C